MNSLIIDTLTTAFLVCAVLKSTLHLYTPCSPLRIPWMRSRAVGEARGSKTARAPKPRGAEALQTVALRVRLKLRASYLQINEEVQFRDPIFCARMPYWLCFLR